MGDGLIDTDMPPPDGRGGFKHKFRVMTKPLGPDPKRDGIEKAVFLDGKKLDFSIDVVRLLAAKQKGPEKLREEQARVERQFSRVVSEAIGRRVTAGEIMRASVEVWI